MKIYLKLSLFCALLLLFRCSHIQPSEEQKSIIDLDKLDSKKLPYKFQLVDVKTSESHIAVDLDGDGTDEFVLVQDVPLESQASNYILIEELERNRTIAHLPFKGRIKVPLIDDLDNNGTKEIFMSLAAQDSTWLYILDNKGKTLLKHLAAVRPVHVKNGWECLVIPEHLIDINKDGHLDLIYRLQTGNGYQPRDIVAFDIYNNRKIWSWATGQYVIKTALHDLDNDGEPELILGSNAPGNSNYYSAGNPMIHGTDDTSSRIDVLSLHGKPQEGKRLGGQWSEMNFEICDLDGDGDATIVVMFSSHNKKKEPSYITIWDYQNNRFEHLKKLEKESYLHIACLNVMDNGIRGIITGWEDGTIEIRGPDLDVLKSRQFPGLTQQNFITFDINNDGENEIIVSGKNRDRFASFVLDRDLNVEALCDKDMRVDQIVDPGYGEDKLLLTFGFLDVRRTTQLYAIKRQYSLPVTIPWTGLVTGFVLGGLFIFILSKSDAGKAQDQAYRKILDASGLPAYIVDGKGIIEEINQRACLLVDTIRDESVGAHYSAVFKADAWRKLNEVIENALAGSATMITQELSITVKGIQSDFILSVNPLRIRDNRSGRLVLLFDVTDLAQSKRAVAWASMAQKLAHEIKTPLSTVMLSTQHLQMECEADKGIKTKLNKYIQRIYTQVSRLQKLTDSFLKFSRIENPKFERLDMNRLLQDWLEENKFKLGSGITVELKLADDLPDVMGDLQQLKIVIQNLIENSLKAMEGKGVLTVTTRLVQSLHTKNGEMPGTGVQVEVSDTGKGMGKTELEQLFMPFFSKSPGGTGLGLVITKKIIDDHKGTITVESEPEIGTSVFFTIPA